MRDRKKRNIVIGVLCCLLVFMGIGYAILSQTLTINGIGNVKGNWDVKITDMKLIEKTGTAEELSNSFTDTSASFAAKLYMPGDSVEYEVTVTNSGNIDAILQSITPTITNENQGIKFTNTLIDTSVLTAGKTISFRMKVKIDEKETSTPTTDKSEYTLQLVYVQYDGNSEYTPPVQSVGTLSERILADNTAQSDSSIDFSQISSDTNGKGLYYTSTNTEGNATTYYFRGAVDNNYVKFGTQTKNKCTYNGKDVSYFTVVGSSLIFEYNPTEEHCLSTNVCENSYYGTVVGLDDTSCTEQRGTSTGEKATFTANVTEDILWRVVRINEDGSIRMISEDPIGYSDFNGNRDDNTSMGYMYGTIGGTTYEEVHSNINDSTIKTYLDNWYQDNLLSYTSYMSVDAGFCNDRSIYSGLGYGTQVTNYGAYNRLYKLKQPQFVCPQTNDLFTITTSSKGNKALTYPIGLITLDEAVYAGGVFGGYSGAVDSPVAVDNRNYYLRNDFDFFTMSPVDFKGTHTNMNPRHGSNIGYIGSFGEIIGDVVERGGYIRPVINIKVDVNVGAGDGTLDNPYFITIN